MKKLRDGIATLIVTFLYASSAVAATQFRSPERAVAYRSAAFTIMSTQMETLSNMVKGKQAFNAAEAKTAATIINFASRLPEEAFIPNTSIKEIPKSEAKPELFSNKEEVKELFAKLTLESSNLVVNSDSLEKLKVQFPKVANTCQTCHKKYKES